MKQLRRNGFTLIELLVVITILAIMAAVGVSSYQVANQKARDGRRAADIQQVRSALELWRSDCGAYPITASWITLMGGGTFPCSGVNKNFVLNYLGNRPVNDPKGASYTYNSVDGSTYSVSYTKEIFVGNAVETFLNP